MLLVSKENCVGNCMLAVKPKGSQSTLLSKSCDIDGYAPGCE
jgi:hypothetical protein